MASKPDSATSVPSDPSTPKSKLNAPQKQSSLLPQLVDAQKQIVAMQWELKSLKATSQDEREQSKELHRRIQELEEDNADLSAEKETMEDRHESHMEELQFLQNEFFCIKSHLVKLKNEMTEFNKILNWSNQSGISLIGESQGGGWFSSNKPKDQPDPTQFENMASRLVDRQEFTVLVLDSTITSLKEILEEYVPPAPGKMVEEINEYAPVVEPPPPVVVEEPKHPRAAPMKRGESDRKRHVSISEIPEPESLKDGFGSQLPPIMEKKKSKRGGLIKKLSRKMSSRNTKAVHNKSEHSEEMSNIIHQMFKENQIRFAQYVETGEQNFKSYAKSRKSWGLSNILPNFKTSSSSNSPSSTDKFQEVTMSKAGKQRSQRMGGTFLSPTVSPRQNLEKRRQERRNK